MSNTPKITPVILSGGSGTRLWPASRPGRPKQLIALIGQHTLLQATALRVAGRGLFKPPVVVTSNELGPAVADQLVDVGVEVRTLILEPAPRGTAPAIAIAALMLADEDADAVLAVLPSDHTIADEEAFENSMRTALAAANASLLTAFGVSPTAPETIYGYICQGKPYSGIDGCFHLESFVEKPDLATATRYLAAGNFLWNSGMFVFSARSYLCELERQEPEMLGACRRALGEALRSGDHVEIDRKAFAGCPAGSIDRAVMERTNGAAVIPVDLGWSDIGAWAAVWEIGEKDSSQNVVFGEAELANVEGCLIYNECNTCLEVTGVSGIVVASTPEAIFVAERARSSEIGGLVPLLGADSNDLPVSDASVQMDDGVQIVKIGCPNIHIATAPESVRVIGKAGKSYA